MEQQERKVVLGLGNILNRDEGMGVHAVKALEAQIGDLAGVEWVVCFKRRRSPTLSGAAPNQQTVASMALNKASSACGS